MSVFAPIIIAMNSMVSTSISFVSTPNAYQYVQGANQSYVIEDYFNETDHSFNNIIAYENSFAGSSGDFPSLNTYNKCLIEYEVVWSNHTIPLTYAIEFSNPNSSGYYQSAVQYAYIWYQNQYVHSAIGACWTVQMYGMFNHVDVFDISSYTTRGYMNQIYQNDNNYYYGSAIQPWDVNAVHTSWTTLSFDCSFYSLTRGDLAGNLDELFDEYYQDGYNRGYETGYALGLNDNSAISATYQDGFNSGYNLGYTEGYNKGEADGIQEGINRANDAYQLGQQENWQEAYDNGWRDGVNAEHDDIWQEGYDIGKEDGWSDGYSDAVAEHPGWFDYQAGYTAGLNEGIAQRTLVPVIFQGILTVAMLPVNIFLKILNFNLFGVNIGSFICSLFTVAIVIYVIRSFTGGSSSD